MATEADLRERRRWAYENPRPDVQALVPPTARRVLDLGCSSGALGAQIKRRQDAFVVGVEIVPEYSAAAQERLDRVLMGDAEHLLCDGTAAELGPFDCVLAADVLEHFRDPWKALRLAVDALCPGGAAVVSLPNVRYWETFFQLAVRGSWPRRSEGIFDRTHLRWFTLRDALELMTEAGLEVDRVSPQYRLKPHDWRTARQGAWFARTPLRELFVFQWVLSGLKRD